MEPTVHLINGVDYKAENGLYRMVVEIPAGTNEKWQTDAITGELYFEHVNGKPRIINFLSYPFNYGFIPQTVLDKDKGGDGDPLDIVLLSPAQPRGSVHDVKVLGALKLQERGEADTKIVAILPHSSFHGVDNISDLLMQYPGAVEIIRLWFEGYKGPGSFLFQGYATRDEAIEIIEQHFEEWQAAHPSVST